MLHHLVSLLVSSKNKHCSISTNEKGIIRILCRDYKLLHCINAFWKDVDGKE